VVVDGALRVSAAAPLKVIEGGAKLAQAPGGAAQGGAGQQAAR
jgi:hypothetical protein